MSNSKVIMPTLPLDLEPDEARAVIAARPMDMFEVAVRNVYADAETLLLKKHHDYGPKNISNSPGGPMNGLLVRMHDKQARLANLLLERKADPQVDESIEDTLIDLANYALIGVLVARGQWPTS
jgi:hypothetical protein